jgi:hypothetical protein
VCKRAWVQPKLILKPENTNGKRADQSALAIRRSAHVLVVDVDQMLTYLNSSQRPALLWLIQCLESSGPTSPCTHHLVELVQADNAGATHPAPNALVGRRPALDSWKMCSGFVFVFFTNKSQQDWSPHRAHIDRLVDSQDIFPGAGDSKQSCGGRLALNRVPTSRGWVAK